MLRLLEGLTVKKIEEQIETVESEIAEMDEIMSSPDSHPEVNLDNDWYNLYGEKKNKLQTLMEQWEKLI